METIADISATDEGSIVLFSFNTLWGKEWADEHIGGECTWFGDRLVCEKRYAEDLSLGMVDDGLTLTVNGRESRRGTGEYEDNLVILPESHQI